MKLLIDYGADLDIVDKEGRTALINAVRQLNIGAMKILLDSGSDKNIRDSFSNS